MSSAGEHHAPLALISGPDARLKWLAAGVCLLGLAALALSPASPALRLPLIAVALTGSWLLVFRKGTGGQSGCRLTVFRQGHCRLDGLNGSVGRRVWLGRRYCVLRVHTVHGSRRLLIAASRQVPSTFRVLVCWLRHRNLSS